MILRAHRYGMIAVVAMAGIIPATAMADTLAIGASQDNTLYEDPDGLLSNGAGQRFFAGRAGNLLVRRGLLEFDIAAAIPAGSMINSVTLTLNCSNAANPDPVEISLHSVLASWGEQGSAALSGEGIGGDAEIGDATWLHRFYDTTSWANPGGDFDPTASASQMIGGLGSYSWSSAGMVADVQSWLDNPGDNHGWMLIAPEIVDLVNARRFDSRNHGNASVRPVLTIDYTVPEPASAALLLAAVAAAGRRKRPS